MSLWLLLLRHGHGDVTGALDDTIAPTFGTSVHPLEHWTAIHLNGRHLQFVDVGAFIMLGVAMADSNTLLMSWAAFLLLNSSTRKARSTDRLRT